MEQSIFFRRALLLVAVATLSSCQPKSSSGGGDLIVPGAPEQGKPAAPIETLPDISIPLEQVTGDGCLQLPKLALRLNELNLPAAAITTDHHARSEMSSELRKYFAFSSFEYRVISSASLLPFPTGFTQEGCKTLRSMTASGEPVLFTISKASESALTLERAKTPKDVPALLIKAFDKRARADKYVIRYEAFTRTLTIETKYSAIDPLCGKEKLHDLSTTRKLTWSSRAELLPESYLIEPDYLKVLKEATLDGNIPGIEEGALHANAIAPPLPAPDLMKCK